MKTNFSSLKAAFINCTLKKSPELSHTEGLMRLSEEIMRSEGATTDFIRLVDYDVATGVLPDMKKKGWDTDAWPALFDRVIRADILVIGTPIWLGERSSVASKLIERLYAMSAQTNDKGQYVYYGKTGGCVITGNEDGIKHCAMGILYALQHLGYTIPPQADCGWIGEVGPGPCYLDENSNARENDFTNRNTTFMTYNLLHMAALLKQHDGFPAYGNLPHAWQEGERWNFRSKPGPA
jgi:multimeric flavodoxin WrbA